MKSELFRVYNTDVESRIYYGDDTTYTDTGLTPNAKYRYKVRFENQSVPSEFSELVIAQTEPSLNASFMRWYYASDDISNHGQEVPKHTTVEATDTTISFESQKNYTGAVGFFVQSSNPVLLGHTFHVLNGSAGKITLANKLPGIPQPGDTFKLFKGGKYASNQEILAMKISGKQPEIQRVIGPHTGVRIVKVSPLVGEGILTLEVSDGTAKIKINDGDFGNPVPVGDFIRVPVFAPDGIAHVIVDMIGTIRAGKDKFTVQPPLASFVPSFTGYETSVGKIRYHLPVIYNLRSSVSNGVRTVSWSAGKSEVSDCVFGVWFSQNTPVDTNRQADRTVFYSPDMTEYSVSFPQKYPIYAAVAAIRTGDNTETGKVHEVFCDWNNTPPRLPDDVIFENPK